MRVIIFTLLSFLFFTSFYAGRKDTPPTGELLISGLSTGMPVIVIASPDIEKEPIALPISQSNTLLKDAEAFVNYAKGFIGTPYVYGSTNPAIGFDCSGFINHVAHHFGLNVPRSSVDYTNFGTDVSMANAKVGDLILFTGTDASQRVVGHMGIVTNSSPDNFEFIHSTSGKAKGVTVSQLKGYYETRFVKVIRILDNDNVG